MLKFERIKIGDVTFEAAAAMDVNQNGILDIVSGGYWFEGPDFQKAHKICDIRAVDDYFDDFSDYPMDVNGNGYPDIITGGWWGETLQWRENPAGKPGEWETHDIDKTGNIERGCFWDIDGDGQIEIVPNCPGKPPVAYKLILDDNGKGTGKFKKIAISSVPQGHGLGFGDITGNGRGDLITAGGFYEAPENPLEDEWTWRPEFDLASASVPVLVHDITGNGLNDLIVGQSHAYGLAWWEQGKGADGQRTWTKHDIDTDRSQYHDIGLADLDNDGEMELVTGKRYRAHCGHDPGGDDPIGTYYFKFDKAGNFTRYTLDYGDPAEASGVGIYFWIADLDGNGWKDIIAPGKEGLYVFKNMGPA